MENQDLIWRGEPGFKEYRLEIRSDDSGWGGRRLNLFCSDCPEPEKVEPKTLALLEYFASKPVGTVISDETIRKEALHRSDVNQYIKRLRHALRDREEDRSGKPPRFIARVRGSGYKFLRAAETIPLSFNRPAVNRDQFNLTFPRLYEEWDQPRFFELLKEIERDAIGGRDEGDLRIVTSLFHDVMDLQLHKLLLKGCHIKILMMNPKNRGLIRARYSNRRTDYGPAPADKALKDLNRQIVELTKLLPQAATREKPDCGGTIELRLSNIMPCGFVILGRKRALLGAMLAHRSYVEGGPMIEVSCDNTTLWELLNGDWKARWEDAERPFRKRP